MRLKKDFAMRSHCHQYDAFAQVYNDLLSQYPYNPPEQILQTAKSFWERGLCGWPVALNEWEKKETP